ncbi:MAG: hypothetical protein ABWZ66_04040 [Pyrinomonadaceae bacterium]
MNTEFENGHETLTDETRRKLKDLSKALLRLHKTLLDAAKIEYETKFGAIAGANQYLQLVIDDPHFAWLRKLSALIALVDEAASIRRAASEPDARALLKEAQILLNFEDEDEVFNDKFQTALQKNPDAVINHNDALQIGS